MRVREGKGGCFIIWNKKGDLMRICPEETSFHICANRLSVGEMKDLFAFVLDLSKMLKWKSMEALNYEHNVLTKRICSNNKTGSLSVPFFMFNNDCLFNYKTFQFFAFHNTQFFT
jgi:hypothetical protein